MVVVVVRLCAALVVRLLVGRIGTLFFDLLCSVASAKMLTSACARDQMRTFTAAISDARMNRAVSAAHAASTAHTDSAAYRCDAQLLCSPASAKMLTSACACDRIGTVTAAIRDARRNRAVSAAHAASTAHAVSAAYRCDAQVLCSPAPSSACTRARRPHARMGRIRQHLCCPLESSPSLTTSKCAGSWTLERVSRRSS